MSAKLFNKFWGAVTAAITMGLLACFREYWIAILFEKKRKGD